VLSIKKYGNYFWKGMSVLLKKLRTKRKESYVSVRQDGVG
jgi:hypothetical protein